MIWISIFLLAWGGVAALMLLLWIINYFKPDPDRIDLFWGIGVLLAGVIFLCHDDITPPRLYVLSLLGFWAGRLSAYLWLIAPIRIRPEKLAFALKDKSPKGFKVLWHYQLQGLLMVSAALPCLLMGRLVIEMGLIQFAFGTVILFMIILQSVADTQLYEHLSHKTDELYHSNLWHTCRHPNYFFEGLMWLGFALMACTLSFGWVSLLSPIIYFLAAKLFWLPFMEHQLTEHFDQTYQVYQKQSFALFFRIPKKQ